MDNIALRVENLGKQYRLGLVGTGTISHDLNRWWHKIRGKEDPYLKIGEVNNRTITGDSDYVWALRDINFEVKQGEVLGIIGKNGAGKSTLLKILSKVTGPSTGEIKANGRIASLLEVGTGFHPELTGIENIFLNGAILGMTRTEVKNKLEEIIDFSGVERYIDTPVKRYSSGMYVRLAFAVAAHLEPEILIVDEVLAVGDAEFQKKCLGKMKDVSGQGRTVLFVSHNMGSISELCSRTLLLENGTVVKDDLTSRVIDQYLKGNASKENLPFNKEHNFSIIKSANIFDSEHKTKEIFDINDKIIIEIQYELLKDFDRIDLTVLFYKEGDLIIFTIDTDKFIIDNNRKKGSYKQEIRLVDNTLAPGNYTIDLFLRNPINGSHYNKIINALSFTIDTLKMNSDNKGYAKKRGSKILLPGDWVLIND